MSGQKRFVRTFCSFFFLAALLLGGLAACGNGSAGNTSVASSGSGNISTPTPTSIPTLTPTSASTPIPTPTLTPTPTPTPTVTPTTTPGSGVPLTVTQVDMAVRPISMSIYPCGTTVTVTYTATFHFPANNIGGPVAFQYTTDNGRGTTSDSLTVQPGQTTATYKFTWKGTLPADHTMPAPGGVMVNSPNQINSPMLGPSGQCL